MRVYGSDGTESAYSGGDTGLIPGSGYPIQYSRLENSMDRGGYSLFYGQVGYIPQHCKKLGTTEQLTHTHTYAQTYTLLCYIRFQDSVDNGPRHTDACIAEKQKSVLTPQKEEKSHTESSI